MTATVAADPRVDRLYDLLPAIYRVRDADGGYPLKALLRVIGEQVNLVEDAIGQQYENWFVETAADWALPYIGDLVGLSPTPYQLASPGAGAEEALRDRWLTPRREVAGIVGWRRRKGTLALLEELAEGVAAWPALAVEFYRRLGWSQNIDHLHLDRAQLADIRSPAALDRLGGAFDPFAHEVDVRRIDSRRTLGRTNIPSVGVFVWRLGSYGVTQAPAACEEEAGPNCYTFSILGQDAPLFTRPVGGWGKGADEQEALRFPQPIRRRAFEAWPDLYYGPERSFTLWAEDWPAAGEDGLVPLTAVTPADLSGWFYVPKSGKVAVDPVLGRIVFPPGQNPRKGIRVSYRYGFSAPMGGGEYPRRLSNPSPRQVAVPDPDNPGQTVLTPGVSNTYRVGKGEAFQKIGDALAAWTADAPSDAVIELVGSEVYVEPLQIDLPAGSTLQLRAASGSRPVIRLIDWRADLPDALGVRMGAGSRFTLDGLTVTGRAVQVSGPPPEPPPPPPEPPPVMPDRVRPSAEGLTAPAALAPSAAVAGPLVGSAPYCDSTLVIRHCTLVPGWGIDCDCDPDRPSEPSLELTSVRCQVVVEHSILGSIRVQEDEVRLDPIPVRLSDSILDAAQPGGEAVYGLEGRPAHLALTVLRCTVFGIVDVHSVPLGENSIFNDCVHVARRQLGCLRYCYVPYGCRTPRRVSCQPDLAVEKVKAAVKDIAAQAADIAAERLRLAPVFTDRRYGRPGYAQLSDDCAAEIGAGADDRSEMGVFHDLFQPLREANLAARLNDFTPAGADVGIVHVT